MTMTEPAHDQGITDKREVPDLKDLKLADRARRLADQGAEIARLKLELRSRDQELRRLQQQLERTEARTEERLQSRARKLAEQKAEIARLSKAAAEAEMEARQANFVASHLVGERTALRTLPPEHLRLHVGTRTTGANFLANGLIAAERVLELFGNEPDGPVLDWGCGSGRTLNWLLPVGTWRERYRGTDVDAEAIGWLRDQGVTGVSVCQDDPPLPYDDATFTGLFSFSVLTHIPPLAHRRWYEEIRRVLRPGGRALLTTQGEAIVAARRVSEETVAHYQREGWAYQHMDGHYKAAALASPAFTSRLLEDLFEIEDYTVTGYSNMDAILVRKPD